MQFSTLRRNLNKDYSGFKTIKVAILGDTPTQFLHQALKGYGYEARLNFDIFEADYDQVDMQVMNGDSSLYAFEPDFVIVFQATRKLLSRFYDKSKERKHDFASIHIEKTRNLVSIINQHINTQVIYSNFPEIDDSVFGNFANKTNTSFIYQIRKINIGLMDLAREIKNLSILDNALLHTLAGHSTAFSNTTYINTGIVHDIDFWPAIAKGVTDIIEAISGKFKKAIILDLDNTLWGGTIGDDGIENIQIGELGIGNAFTELQAWLKQLRERGIILAICSKNYENIAREPFEKHPEMKLRLEDIAVFVANWDNKVDNIRYIQSVLSFDFDSIVYLDDNPFERNMVKSDIPELCIPELPEDPSEYLSYLQGLNLFETASLTEEDKNRTKQYQEEEKRIGLQKAYENEDGFLQSLEMICTVKPFDKFNTPRVAQLSQRSNQFNLRSIRYTELDIERIRMDNNFISLTFSLEDKFGDYGLISVAILEKKDDYAFIDTWFMSCRVLKRGMEKFIMNTIVEAAEIQGIKRVKGQYIPTSRNELAKDIYKTLGLEEKDGYWVLNVGEYKPIPTFIAKG